MTSSSSSPLIEIYTRCDKCPYSREIVDLSSSLKLQTKVKILDLSRVQPPDWLPGTPSVVCENKVYCGDAGFQFLESIGAAATDEQEEGTEEGKLYATTSPYNKLKQLEPKMTMQGKTESGLDLAQAFLPPPFVDSDSDTEEPSRGTTNDMMARLLAERR